MGSWEQSSLHKSQQTEFIAFERTLKESQVGNLDEYYGLLLETAPETLTRNLQNILVSKFVHKSSDTYSFGVVALEIFMEKEPFSYLLDSLQQSHINMLEQSLSGNLYPATFEEILKHDRVGHLIWSTWNTSPEKRPTFPEIIKRIKEINPKQKTILDNMMYAVEQYAQSLEEKVAERTCELEKTTKSFESLLNSMFPSTLAAKLAKGEQIEPEYYDG